MVKHFFRDALVVMCITAFAQCMMSFFMLFLWDEHVPIFLTLCLTVHTFIICSYMFRLPACTQLELNCHVFFIVKNIVALMAKYLLTQLLSFICICFFQQTHDDKQESTNYNVFYSGYLWQLFLVQKNRTPMCFYIYLAILHRT